MAEALDSYSDLDLSDSDENRESNELNERFLAAADHVKFLVSSLGSDTLLKIYSYYKQATEGQCNIPRPKWYEVQAKQKWDAWNSLGDLSTDVAKEKYIAIVSELDPKWEKNSKNISSKTSQGWVTVSSFCTSEELDDGEKTIFDYCKDGDIWQVQTLLKLEPLLINSLDSNGLGLIHWATDRGYLDIIKILVQNNCNISLKDTSGQSALHYAVSCCHLDCINFLLEKGINKMLKDNDGLLAIDLTNEESVKKLLM